jgi:surface protein
MVLEYEIPNPNTQISLPLYENVNVSVDWGDGNIESFTTSGNKIHTYTLAGTKTVTITGSLTKFGTYTPNTYLKKVISWDNIGLKSLNNAFYYASNLTSVPNYLPNTVTDLSNIFFFATNFNQDISNWNTQNITNMSGMFISASSFDQNISKWNTSNVVNMSYMFDGAQNFNQPIGDWNTSNVTNMNGLFNGAKKFNQNLQNWNTSAVLDMSYMFSGTKSFNQPIGNWNTSNVTNMTSMFSGSTLFNQPINDWNVEKVTSMAWMFDTASSFNQPLSNWNTSNVQYMNSMFSNAKSFNQNIGNWNISNVINADKMFMNDELCTENYDALIIGWSKQNIKTGINFDGGGSKYTSLASTERELLIINGWNITDGGLSTTSTCPNITNTEEFTQLNLKTYPNPIQEILIIELEIETTANLYNIQGEKIETFNLKKGTNSIKINNLTNGNYLLKIGTKIIKLVKE